MHLSVKDRLWVVHHDSIFGPLDRFPFGSCASSLCTLVSDCFPHWTHSTVCCSHPCTF